MTQWPGIYTPVRLRIKRALAGALPTTNFNGYVRAGEINGDEFSYCVFTTSRPPFKLWDHRTDALAGGTYLAFFGRDIVTGSNDGPMEMPEIVELMVVQGDSFINEGQTSPQPLDS